MAQQTALDWFLASLPDRFKNALITACEEEIEQAKQMEKQQIVEAFINGRLPQFFTNLNEEEYYNRRYKNK